MTGSRPLDRIICGILSRTSLPWLIAALPAVCGSFDPAVTTDSGIEDARDLWISKNTPAWGTPSTVPAMTGSCPSCRLGGGSGWCVLLAVAADAVGGREYVEQVLVEAVDAGGEAAPAGQGERCWRRAGVVLVAGFLGVD